MKNLNIMASSNNNQNGWFSSLSIGFSGGSSGGGGSSGDNGQTVSNASEKIITTTIATTTAAAPASGSQTEVTHFESIDRTTAASNTLKRNMKVEFTRSDLLQLLSYYEGEFQARDIVIAALKSEKLKEVVNLGRYRPVVLNDPYTALLRDMFADGPNAKPPYNDKDVAILADQQLEALENLVIQQRRAQIHMANIIRDAELKHKKVIHELEEEKCKHEHDTAQGDDITYGLEMERTRLKQELDLERQARKKLDKELKRQLEISDEEKARQKQIVLLLLAERKKIILKYIEERKRSEDLAQILSEEKTRIDTMAEGLEEESKKSLQMEAELEKQMQLFDTDRKALHCSITEYEKRCRDLETELRKTKTECESLRNQLVQIRGKGSPRSSEDLSSAPMTSSVAKVVQPTATVSSVPVSGPTTGIAQSVSPGQGLRQTATPVVQASGGVGSSGTGVRVLPSTPPILNQSRSVPIGSSSIPAVTVAPTTTINTSATKAPFHTTTATSSPGPGTVVQLPPPKKGTVLGRGLPPPIPPNKPVIVTKQTVQRRPDQPDGDKKKPVSSTGTTVAGKSTDEQPSSAHSHPHPPGIEMLGQELADFQQMFVTMATGNNS